MPIIHIQFKSGRGRRKWEVILCDASTPPVGHFCHYSHEAETHIFLTSLWIRSCELEGGGVNHSTALFKINVMFNLFHLCPYIQHTWMQWIPDCMGRKLSGTITGGGTGIFFHSFIFVQQRMPINHIESSSLSKWPMRGWVGCCCVLRNILAVLSQIPVTVANFSLVPAAAEPWGGLSTSFSAVQNCLGKQTRPIRGKTMQRSRNHGCGLMVLSMPLHWMLCRVQRMHWDILNNN